MQFVVDVMLAIYVCWQSLNLITYVFQFLNFDLQFFANILEVNKIL